LQSRRGILSDLVPVLSRVRVFTPNPGRFHHDRLVRSVVEVLVVFAPDPWCRLLPTQPQGRGSLFYRALWAVFLVTPRDSSHAPRPESFRPLSHFQVFSYDFSKFLCFSHLIAHTSRPIRRSASPPPFPQPDQSLTDVGVHPVSRLVVQEVG